MAAIIFVASVAITAIRVNINFDLAAVLFMCASVASGAALVVCATRAVAMFGKVLGHIFFPVSFLRFYPIAH